MMQQKFIRVRKPEVYIFSISIGSILAKIAMRWALPKTLISYGVKTTIHFHSPGLIKKKREENEK